MGETKHKILSTLIVSIGAFLGFQAVSYVIGIYQLKSAVQVAFYIYFFHIFWLTFLFDLHLKKRGVFAVAKLNHQGAKLFWEACKQRLAHLRRWEYLRHYQNYLVLPGLLYWSTVVLLLLNPFAGGLKQAIVFSSSIAMSVAYWFMKEHVSRRLESQHHWILILSIVKLFAAFLVYTALIWTAKHYGFGADFLLPATITLTFLLLYQALFQHNFLNFHIFIWIVIIALAMGVVSFWVFENWNTQYFSAGLVMLAVYNTMWGILHHYLDKTLTRKVVFEYLAMMLLIISILFASHNFNQKVI
jgi:hypothetical protein